MATNQVDVEFKQMMEASWGLPIGSPVEAPVVNPLHDRLQQLSALKGIHLLQLPETEGGTSLLIAGAGVENQPNIKQSIVTWGARVHHFFFDAAIDAAGTAYGMYEVQTKRHPADEDVIYHSGMPPLIKPLDLAYKGLMMHVGRKHQETSMPRASHLDLVATEETAVQFLAATEKFVGREDIPHVFSETLNIHVY